MSAPIAGDYLPDRPILPTVPATTWSNPCMSRRCPRIRSQETRWLCETAQCAILANAIVAHADLNAPDVEKQLAAQAAFDNVRGIRQIVNWHPDARFTFTPHDLLTDSAWLAGSGCSRNMA